MYIGFEKKCHAGRMAIPPVAAELLVKAQDVARRADGIASSPANARALKLPSSGSLRGLTVPPGGFAFCVVTNVAHGFIVPLEREAVTGHARQDCPRRSSARGSCRNGSRHRSPKRGGTRRAGPTRDFRASGYYNLNKCTYPRSYISSNSPRFFNGLRMRLARAMAAQHDAQRKPRHFA